MKNMKNKQIFYALVDLTHSTIAKYKLSLTPTVVSVVVALHCIVVGRVVDSPMFQWSSFQIFQSKRKQFPQSLHSIQPTVMYKWSMFVLLHRRAVCLSLTLCIFLYIHICVHDSCALQNWNVELLSCKLSTFSLFSVCFFLFVFATLTTRKMREKKRAPLIAQTQTYETV